MSDDRPDDDIQLPEGEDGSSEIPASVTFMEMMRQAAARAGDNHPPSAAEQLFARAAEQDGRTVVSSTSGTGTPARTAQNPIAQLTEQRRVAAIEEQRIKRVKRRRARQRRQTVGVIGGIIRSVFVIFIASILMATIFTWWTPSQFIRDSVRAELMAAESVARPTEVPTAVPTPNWLRRIGVVAGHRGPQVPPDPGAVCPDGLTEAEVNFAVAQRVVRNLRGFGYSVDLLDEFDPRLDSYQAAALVSIHANTCKNFGERVSGYLIARAASRSGGGPDDVLVDCVSSYYQQAVGLERREGLTLDMTDYHTFREIHPLTPAAIIELGFLLADRDILTGKQDEMALGITNGVRCFLEPSQVPATPVPSPAGNGS